MLRPFDPALVHSNLIDGRVRFRSEFGYRFAVDRYAAFRNQFLRGAAGGDACGGDDLLKPNLHTKF